MSSSSTPRKRSHSDVDDSDLPTFDDPADLVNAVISTLQRPEEHTNVAATFANDKNLATEIQAYAKIAGCDWTFYVKSLAISIGRNTDNNNTNLPAAAGGQISGGKGSVDIDLGPAKVVSRQHATITYNLDLRCWELQVLGRNGARIDGQKVPVGPNHSTPLHSGAILDVGGTQMMFILPDSPPNISQKILTKCLTKYKEMKKKYNGSVNSYQAPSNQIRSFQMFDKAQLIQSPSSVSATSLQNNLDQDLSKEEAKDIKPPYSYATMITQAILSNEDGVMSLSEIYNWIGSHYAYYKYSKTGWQNSIRHNLSLNKAFEKVPRRPNEPGKGMKWQISESYKEDFMSKIENGSLSKNRRGSSVSRQLHLHLATHKHLPESQKNYQQENSIESQLHHNQQKQLQQHQQEQQGHQHQQFQPQFSHSRTNSLPKLEHTYPINNNPLSYMANQNGYMGAVPGQRTYQPNFQPNLMYGAPLINQPVHLNQHNGIAGQVKSELSSPTRQLNDINTTTPKLPKVGGSHLFNLPPPPPHTLGHSAPAHSRSNSYNPPEMNYNSNPNTTEENQQSASTSTNTNNNNSTANTTTTATASDLALGFASPKKIAPLEAFTPERGSKSVNVKLGVNGVNTNQSSPAFWNFVQFSTPNGQTPLSKNSDESNSQGSPTTSRKRPETIYNDKDDNDKGTLSPLKPKTQNETEKA